MPSTVVSTEAEHHIGTHARLLAGPGTGKTTTIVKRIANLIQSHAVTPSSILALTFTRAAAASLRTKATEMLSALDPSILPPRVSTLHSFALRQILRNSSEVTTLPRPVRIADDWEEENIILPDLKRLLNHDKIRTTRRKLNELSASWETLDVEDPSWRQTYPDPKFLSAWEEHRKIFGYTLRAELVLQLKRALETNPSFKLEPEFSHLLVDEYQDLNRCDLAVIRALVDKGAEVFATGDDDQSIYGFRFAFPTGIREMPKTYSPFNDYILTTCWRCDAAILAIGQFVAKLDYERAEKDIHPRLQAGDGEVTLLTFPNNNHEASGVARLCTWLTESQKVLPGDILILVRSDRGGKYSTPLLHAIENLDIPVANKSAEVHPLSTIGGRTVLSYLRLKLNSSDHLAWRSLIQLKPGLGEETWNAIYQAAQQSSSTFSHALTEVTDGKMRVGPRARILREYIATIQFDLNEMHLSSENQEKTRATLSSAITALVSKLIGDDQGRAPINAYFETVLSQIEPASLESLLEATSAKLAEEQVLEPGRVNILTMHQAKGLEADVVIIAGAEDEQIPGAAEGSAIGDERRLLYVSLTRARKRLYLTTCRKRFGRQQYTLKGNQSTRTLTRFLRLYAPLKAVSLEPYLAQHPSKAQV